MKQKAFRLKENPKKQVPLEQSVYLLHPYGACLVTSKGKNGRDNVMTVAWIIPVSMNPPLLAMSIRPERHSYRLLIETGEFIVNIATFEMCEKVLFCGRRSGRDCDKFKETKMTRGKATIVDVPTIDECIAHIECKVANTVEAGDHILIIGQIVAACAMDGYFEQIYDIKKFRPCMHMGKNYFTTCTEQKHEPKIQQTSTV